MTPEQRQRLETALSALPPGIWEVWTSNSYRRVSARDERGRLVGGDGGVLHAYKQRDGHPDLSMTERQLAALCEIKNICSELALDGAPPRRCDTDKCDPGGECPSCGAWNGEVCRDPH